jgi:hypothetical protein
MIRSACVAAGGSGLGSHLRGVAGFFGRGDSSHGCDRRLEHGPSEKNSPDPFAQGMGELLGPMEA